MKCVTREQVHVDRDVLTGGRVQLVTVSNVHTSYYMWILICVWLVQLVTVSNVPTSYYMWIVICVWLAQIATVCIAHISCFIWLVQIVTVSNVHTSYYCNWCMTGTACVLLILRVLYDWYSLWQEVRFIHHITVIGVWRAQLVYCSYFVFYMIGTACDSK